MYLRVVYVNPLRLADIPIQVSEIRVRPDSIEDLHVFAATEMDRAKKKPGTGLGQTLLCSMRGVGQVPVDFGELRTAFLSRGEWPYDRIVLVGNAGGISFATTLFVREGCGEHFYLRMNEAGKVDAYTGATLEEMNRNRNEGRGSTTIRY